MVVNKYDNAKFVEIGVWMGKSACYMGTKIKEAHKNIQFDAIDTFEGTAGSLVHQPIVEENGGSVFQKFQRNVRALHLQDYIRPVINDSIQASKDYVNESIDFIFIDGDHSYDAVRADIVTWTPKLKKDGIIAGHDIDAPEVKRAVESVFGNTWKQKGNCWIYEN